MLGFGCIRGYEPNAMVSGMTVRANGMLVAGL
jgi:hypothetical protein